MSPAAEFHSRIEPDEDEDLDNQPKPSKKQRVTLENAASRDEVNEERRPTTSKRTRAPIGNPTEIDEEVVDVSMQLIDEEEPSREDERRDIDNFFQSPVVKTIDGRKKKYCICKLCSGKKSLVNEITTLRSHLEAHHLGGYRKWARGAEYESRLPGDIKKRKAAGEILDRMLDDIRERKRTGPVVPYIPMRAFFKLQLNG